MQHVVLFEDDVVHWMLDFLRRRGLLQSMRALEREANVCTLAGITQEGLYLRSLVLDGKWSALHRALDVLLPPLSPFSSSSTSTPASPARNTRSGGRTQPPTVSPEAARQLRFLVKRQEYIELLAFDPATDDELPEAIKGKVLAIQQQQHQQKQQQQQAGGNTATHDAAHRHGVGGGGGGGGGHDGRGGGGISNPQRAGVVSPALNAMMMANGQAGGVTTTGAGAPISNGHAGSSGGGSGGGVITEGHLVISKALLTAVLALLAEMKQLCTDQAEFASLCQLLTHERLTDVPSYRTWTRAGSRLNLFDRVHGILGPMLGMPPPAVAPPPSSSSGTPAAGNGAAHDTTAPLFPPDYLDTLLGLGLIRLKRELKGVSDAYVEGRA
ncbi:hypothetical protein PTSG_10503 [Salpingoeca rosetta]|uniref:LisH domain-containing protein n=1 Tax=Salpingoeca rosetta (strain ATCC 50818 / BSB-021) TaxID=946362 RepID=F2UPV0_SALR5|nr:uncharacterized protein PTSG_10503 [Salpingoeca rosetta]EGD79655.1 hypothetical protein PTSG_10503 [Salpingoeca rosetta]|eukprot:XP_004988883.1 hypothetical protein PTSG_10503 [Salpingoeca rosetta]